MIASNHLPKLFLLMGLLVACTALHAGTAANGEPIRHQPGASLSLLDSIVAANKGKVLYIDIWATWCGPCREQFPYSTKLEQAFGSNVVFIYLCIDSNEPSFKKMVRNLQRTGKDLYLNTTQSNLLKEQYAITAIPYYLMIDRSGKLVHSGFNIRPSERRTETLLKALVVQRG